MASLTNEEMIVGQDSYDWMGQTMHSFVANDKYFVAISSPDAAYDNGCVHGGKIDIRDVNNLDSIAVTLCSDHAFENFGKSIISGELFIEVMLATNNTYI